MQVLLAAAGTRDEVQPLLALGVALRARGHAVQLAAPSVFARSSKLCGIGFVPLGQPLSASVSASAVRHADAAGRPRPRAALRELAARLREHFVELAPHVARADVLLSAGQVVAGVSLAERYGKRFHQVVYGPQAIPSRDHPATFLAAQSLPAMVNRASWWLAARAHDALLRPLIDAERALLGLAPSRPAWRHRLWQNLIVAADPALAPLPVDLAHHAPLLHPGALLMPAGASANDSALPRELEQFLGAGPPPLCVCMDEPPGGEGAQVSALPSMVQAVLEAAAMLGLRVLFAMPGMSPTLALPAWARNVENAPLDALLPRCLAVLHDGSAHTVVVAARAGVPQVVVPRAVGIEGTVLPMRGAHLRGRSTDGDAGGGTAVDMGRAERAAASAGLVADDLTLPHGLPARLSARARAPADAVQALMAQVLMARGAGPFYWAARVLALGLGPRPITRQGGLAPALLDALAACRDDAGLRARTRAFAPKVTADGVARVVELLEGVHSGPVRG